MKIYLEKGAVKEVVDRGLIGNYLHNCDVKSRHTLSDGKEISILDTSGDGVPDTVGTCDTTLLSIRPAEPAEKELFSNARKLWALALGALTQRADQLKITEMTVTEGKDSSVVQMSLEMKDKKTDKEIGVSLNVEATFDKQPSPDLEKRCKQGSFKLSPAAELVVFPKDWKSIQSIYWKFIDPAVSEGLRQGVPVGLFPAAVAQLCAGVALLQQSRKPD